jgi:hypothetical protein
MVIWVSWILLYSTFLKEIVGSDWRSHVIDVIGIMGGKLNSSNELKCGVEFDAIIVQCLVGNIIHTFFLFYLHND